MVSRSDGFLVELLLRGFMALPICSLSQLYVDVWDTRKVYLAKSLSRHLYRKVERLKQLRLLTWPCLHSSED
ncbi:hypothetical protein CFBP6109_P100030 (plasmid) [Pseudomonas syringae pv. cerasicola]|uniref:Uncharacterized protein n=1 Tax=Pseudomonas syringae pv. cerasicola TaxID=264451 RepID=A0A330JVD5_PSESX|nr:hypothetical protein CFBP6109_P100021 [Pseudomonas syringae pv. cerasicola]SOS31041.1 hypothetical protein CFBP6109_P100030 [Pseudomonas syringae pv. cerasicola]SPD89330.1 hypothetical protein PSCFBP6110_P100055 [Pseudomonas syringae pv. cerasicola]